MALSFEAPLTDSCVSLSSQHHLDLLRDQFMESNELTSDELQLNQEHYRDQPEVLAMLQEMAVATKQQAQEALANLLGQVDLTLLSGPHWR